MTTFEFSLLIFLIFAGTAIAIWYLKRPRVSVADFTSAQPASHQIKVSGLNLHYLRKGKGETVVLLHGIGASTYTWRFLLEALAQDFDVIALDLPGFGNSDKPLDFNYGLDGYTELVDAFLTRLEIGPYYIVGSSMGATIALNLLRSTPHKIIRTVALAPAVRPNVAPPGLMALLPAHRILQRAMTEKTMRTIMALVYSRKELITQEAVREALRPYQANPESMAAFLKATRTFRDPRLPNLFREIEPNSQVLLCRGNNDRMVTQKSVLNLSRILNVPVYNHPSAGHHPHEDEPEWTHRLIRDFFFSPPGQWPQNPV